jgi:hypothetical protein
VNQIRDRLRLDQARVELQISDSELPLFLQGDPEALVQPFVEKIHYDGTTGDVAIELRALERSPVEVQQ